MNHNEHRSDSTLTRELRDSLSELAAPERPSLAAITNRGRAHRQRRLAGFAGLGGAGVAAGAALVLGLTGVLGAAPARSTGTIAAAGRGTGTIAAPARGTGTIRTAAFTLTRNANGTDTLTLRLSQMFDPAVLQRALAQDGIPAQVKIGTYCSSNPPAPGPGNIGPGSSGVMTIEYPNGTPVPRPGVKAVPPAHAGPIAGFLAVINPAKMPSGTELFFGYFSGDRGIFTDLIDTSSYTCGPQLPVTP
jgi:hypothetical protein